MKQGIALHWTTKFQGKDSQILKRLISKKILHFHNAELNEEKLQQIQHSVNYNKKEESDAVVQNLSWLPVLWTIITRWQIT